MDQRLQGPAVMNWRGLREELLRELENAIAVHHGEGGTHHISAADAVIARARAALAQPEPEVVGPTMQLPEQAPDEHPPSNLDRREVAAWYHGHGCGWQAARAVLARWGRPAPAPAGEIKEQAWPPSVANECHEAAISAVTGSPEQQLLVAAGNTIEDLWQRLHWTVPVQPAPAPAGEVGELVDELRMMAGQAAETCQFSDAENLSRAADLLERQAAPVPVAVKQRLPRPEDCDAEGRCWFWQTGADGAGKWELCAPCYYPSHYQLHGNTHWLPAHALPSGEVE